ncbi:hypothetical protein [Pseudomonas profundi]|nr:hypothetical protein [Pseudomonas profundi]
MLVLVQTSLASMLKQYTVNRESPLAPFAKGGLFELLVMLASGWCF